MKKEVENIIKSVVTDSDFKTGKKYDKKAIILNDCYSSNGDFFNFYVRSQYSDYYHYQVYIHIKNAKVIRIHCDCHQFYSNNSCKHVAACLINYSETMFRKAFETVEEKTKRIMSSIKEQLLPTNTRKEEVFLIPSITILRNTYYDKNYILFKVKIGIDKKYYLSTKVNKFLEAYTNGESFTFGKNFSYNPNIHYFSESNRRLLTFIRNLDYSSRDIFLDTQEIDELLEICNDEIFIENFDCKVHVKNEFPYKSLLTKEKRNYILNIDNDSKNIVAFNDDYKYVYFYKSIYRLNKAQQVLLQSCINEEINKLTFNEKDFNSFEESLIPIIKEKIETDETTKDIIIINKPTVRLYFDLLEDSVVCNPNFVYNNNEISFFDTNSNIIRDVDCENNIENVLLDYNFEKGNTSFFLTDLDSICKLLENGFNEIANNYEVYTSKKLKKINIIKNNTVSSTFSIGKDNILRYTFDLGEINSDELSNIMKSINDNKKYYRLKSGDII